MGAREAGGADGGVRDTRRGIDNCQRYTEITTVVFVAVDVFLSELV